MYDKRFIFFNINAPDNCNESDQNIFEVVSYTRI